MKRIGILMGVVLSAVSLDVMAQANDPVVMTVAGTPVLRSEFEYSYNKNNSEGVIDKKTVDEYVELFVNYKMKVQAALDAKMDTAKSFKQEFLTYRDQQIMPSFVSDADIEAEAKKTYDRTKEAIGPRGLILPAHILIRTKTNATPEEEAQVKTRVDSVYNALLGGADFAEMAKNVSADRRTAMRGGELSWVGPNQTVKEFEDAAYALKVGEMSKPVQSPFGYHIILMKDRKQLEPYDSLRSDILKFLESRNIRDRLAAAVVDSLAKKEGVERQVLVDKRAAEMQAKDSDLDNLVREYHDGLLLYEISNREVWDKAAKDEAGLANYFKKNKKKYAWEAPRYKGMAYHVKNEADKKAVVKAVKGLEFDKWADKLRTTFNNDSVIRIRVEKGIFKKGDNAFIDKMVFKKDTTVNSIEGYPIDAVHGKLLKKGPEDYTDVKNLVVADYQDMLEKEWVAALRKRYTYEVNSEVLKTVNKH